MTADENGRVIHEFTVENLSVAEMDNSVVGRAVVVHDKPDTGEQPSGGAGARIGCGAIGVASPGADVASPGADPS